MTLDQKIVHYGSLTVNLGVLCFAGWLFYKAQNESPKTLDPAVQLCRIVK